VVTMHYSTELSCGGSKPVTIVGMLPRLTNVQTELPFRISRYNFQGWFWKFIDIEQYASWLWKFRLVISVFITLFMKLGCIKCH